MSATINYCTIKLPAILFEHSSVVSQTPHFEVRKYNFKKGVFFRVPYGAKIDDVFHAFMEHEINLSNTLRTGTLTMKIQITFVPCHMGVFSGFDVLKGSYEAKYHDDEFFGDEFFKPDYSADENVKNIVPLPPNFYSNLHEFLNEVIFNHVDDAALISKYAVDLGCQQKTIKDKLIPVPVQTGDSEKGASVYQTTVNFFEELTSGKGSNLLPQKQS